MDQISSLYLTFISIILAKPSFLLKASTFPTCSPLSPAAGCYEQNCSLSELLSFQDDPHYPNKLQLPFTPP
jgi:hypothetical protein